MFTQLLTVFKFLFKHCSLGVHAVFILCSWFVHLVGKSRKKGNYFWKVDNLKIQKQLYSLMESDVIRSNSWTQNEHQVNTKWTMHEQNENTTKNSSELLVNNVWTMCDHKMNIKGWTRLELKVNIQLKMLHCHIRFCPHLQYRGGPLCTGRLLCTLAAVYVLRQLLAGNSKCITLLGFGHFFSNKVHSSWTNRVKVIVLYSLVNLVQTCRHCLV